MESNLPIAVRIIIAKERCLRCHGTLWLNDGEWRCSMCGREGGAGAQASGDIVSLTRPPPTGTG